MKQMIQKTTRFGLSLFLLAVLLAGALSLSSTQTAKAWGDVVTVDDFNYSDWNGSSGGAQILNWNPADAIGGYRNIYLATYSELVYTQNSGYLDLNLSANYPYPSDSPNQIGWGESGIYNYYGDTPLNLDVSNHDRVVVTFLQAPTGGSISLKIASGTSGNWSSSTQTFAGAGDYTFLFSDFGSNLNTSDINGLNLEFSGAGLANSTIRIDSVVIRSQPCPVGQYDNGTGCVPADPGYYVDVVGATSETPCPVGTFQPLSGSTSCDQALAGSYVSTTGAASATLCPVGTYQPLDGATSCDPAEPGHFVNTIGSASQTECALGSYQPNYGSISCFLADPGYYVDATGAISQTLCAAGYVSAGGAISCHPINTPPTADAGGPYLGAVNTAIAFNGSLSSDPENDALTYAWDFGDSSNGSGVTPTHSYSAAGVYTVCLTVNDGALDSVDPSCTMAVIYDPSAGFVTGGGWIDSPAGAYMADPSLSSKATFGFVSKYKKGASVPTGNTEFQFKAGDFNFHSDTYDWLVVNQGGKNAQFKGSGTVNGALDDNGNAYKFQLWAGDGSPDTFRIKIWSEDASGVETVVYDNGFNLAIGGGSIVVHSK